MRLSLIKFFNFHIRFCNLCMCFHLLSFSFLFIKKNILGQFNNLRFLDIIFNKLQMLKNHSVFNIVNQLYDKYFLQLQLHQPFLTFISIYHNIQLLMEYLNALLIHKMKLFYDITLLTLLKSFELFNLSHIKDTNN